MSQATHTEADDSIDMKALEDRLSQLPTVLAYGWPGTEGGMITVTLHPDADLRDEAELQRVAAAFNYKAVLTDEWEKGTTAWRLDVV